MPMQISIPPMPLVSSGKEGDSIIIIDQGAALMSLTVFLMALGSAVLHAVWNTLARSRPDPGFGFAAMVVSAGVIGIPLLAYAGLPNSDSYFWLGCSCLFNLATLRLTMMAYRLLPLSLAYPISRAAAPLIVTFIQIIVLGQEHGGVGIVLGIAVISFAIMLLAASARTEDKLDPRGLMFTLAAGVFTAIVVVVDSIGVRLSGNTLGYAAVAAIVNAVTLPILLAFEGVHPRQLLKGNKRFGMMGASVSMVSYLLILLAYQNGPVAPSSAIRETSVVFATAFAALLLGETIGRLRWLAVGLTCVGMVIIRLV